MIVIHTGGTEFLYGSVDKMGVIKYLDVFYVGDGTCSGAHPCDGREKSGFDGKYCSSGEKGCIGGGALTAASCEK